MLCVSMPPNRPRQAARSARIAEGPAKLETVIRVDRIADKAVRDWHLSRNGPHRRDPAASPRSQSPLPASMSCSKFPTGFILVDRSYQPGQHVYESAPNTAIPPSSPSSRSRRWVIGPSVGCDTRARFGVWCLVRAASGAGLSARGRYRRLDLWLSALVFQCRTPCHRHWMPRFVGRALAFRPRARRSGSMFEFPNNPPLAPCHHDRSSQFARARSHPHAPV